MPVSVTLSYYLLKCTKLPASVGFTDTIISKTISMIAANYSLYLLYKVYAGLEVHTKIDKFPFNSFSLVLFLFKDEHMVVEELLQLFVRKIDAQLFETIKLENGTSSVARKRI